MNSPDCLRQLAAFLGERNVEHKENLLAILGDVAIEVEGEGWSCWAICLSPDIDGVVKMVIEKHEKNEVLMQFVN